MSEWRFIGDGFAADIIEKNTEIEGSTLIALILKKAHQKIKEYEEAIKNGKC